MSSICNFDLLIIKASYESKRLFKDIILNNNYDYNLPVPSTGRHFCNIRYVRENNINSYYGECRSSVFHSFIDTTTITSTYRRLKEEYKDKFLGVDLREICKELKMVIQVSGINFEEEEEGEDDEDSYIIDENGIIYKKINI